MRKFQHQFSRREREIMDIVYRLGRATVSEVVARMANAPSYSAVRSTLNILEAKRHLTHQAVGNRYVYLPTTDRENARHTALNHVLETFFDGSTADVVTALLEQGGENLTPDELSRLSALIEHARKEGR